MGLSSFGVNFCMQCEARAQIHSFACDCLVVPAPFVEDSFPHCILVKNRLARDAWAYLWTLDSVPWFSVPVLRPVRCHLDYYSLVAAGFETRKCEFSNFIMFLGCFDYSGSLGFPY